MNGNFVYHCKLKLQLQQQISLILNAKLSGTSGDCSLVHYYYLCLVVNYCSAQPKLFEIKAIKVVIKCRLLGHKEGIFIV